MTSPTNMREARTMRDKPMSVDALRDAIIQSGLPLAAIPSRTTWHRADAASVNGVDPATKGIDSLVCLRVAELLDVPYAAVSPMAADLADSTRDLLNSKMRCSSARVAA